MAGESGSGKGADDGDYLCMKNRTNLCFDLFVMINNPPLAHTNHIQPVRHIEISLCYPALSRTRHRGALVPCNIQLRSILTAVLP